MNERDRLFISITCSVQTVKRETGRVSEKGEEREMGFHSNLLLRVGGGGEREATQERTRKVRIYGFLSQT